MKRLFYKLFGWQKTCKHVWKSSELFDKSIEPKCTICAHTFKEVNECNVTDKEKHLRDIAKNNVSKCGQEKRREKRKANR